MFQNTLHKTVVVIDMVGYSSVARLLEENTDSAIVVQLNDQIRGFVKQALDAQEPSGNQLVAQTGDGAILVFNRAEDAHVFGEKLQTIAFDFNLTRSERTAHRWFRVGVCTGEVTIRTGATGLSEYAGTTIANAVRLEEAARPGEVLIDRASYVALGVKSQSRYQQEETIRGKREEVFQVRRYPVAIPRKTSAEGRLRRRSVVIGAGGFAACTVLGGFLAWPAADRMLHPLPMKRFLALMAWPPPQGDAVPLTKTILDTMRRGLSRFEAQNRDLLVVSNEDVTTSFEKTPLLQASALGANLVVAVSLSLGKDAGILIELLDAKDGTVLRKARERCAATNLSSLGKLATNASVELLDLPANKVRLGTEETQDVPPEAFRLYSQARELVTEPNDSRLEEGITKFQEAINAFPPFAAAYARLSMAYLRRFQLLADEASLRLAKMNSEMAMKYDPDSHNSILSKAAIEIHTGEPEKAIQTISEALKTDPTNPETLFSLASAYGDLGKQKEQERTYREITNLRPNFWQAHNELGLVLSREGDNNGAARSFELASAVAPRVAIPLNNLGYMYLALGKSEEAAAVLQRSIEKSPSDFAYLNLGDIAFTKKDYRGALGDYEQAKQLNPSNHLVWRNIGDCYAMLGQPALVKESYAKAAELVGKSLELNPNSSFRWMTLAFYEAKLAHRETAINDIRQSERHGTADVKIKFLKVQTLALLGNREEALSLLIECVKQGLAPVEVDLALDLASLREDPRYRAVMARQATKLKER